MQRFQASLWSPAVGYFCPGQIRLSMALFCEITPSEANVTIKIVHKRKMEHLVWWMNLVLIMNQKGFLLILNGRKDMLNQQRRVHKTAIHIGDALEFIKEELRLTSFVEVGCHVNGDDFWRSAYSERLVLSLDSSIHSVVLWFCASLCNFWLYYTMLWHTRLRARFPELP